MTTPRVIACAGGVLVHDGKLLLILRGKPPSEGLWSLPGGRCEPGETSEQAVVREVLEETGLVVGVDGMLGSVERPGPGGVVYAIDDFRCTVVGGQLRAGDDAADARWVPLDDVPAMALSDGLVEVLRAWSVL